MFSVTVCAQTPGLSVIVIDPGHGGKDSGAISSDKKTKEKDIVLDISRRFKSRIEDAFPDVKVYMTRSKDEFVELNNRAKFASNKDASLFVSIHINSVEGKVSGPNGYSIHLLGQSADKNKDTYAFNMDVVKRENSVMLLEDDYSTKYQGFDANDPSSSIFLNLMSNANREQSLLFAQLVDENMKKGPFAKSNGIYQNNFAVLRLASMPAVLLEMGFISNPKDLSQLRTNSSLDKIADNLFNAFKDYKMLYDESVGAGKSATTSDVIFGTQIFTSSKVLDKSDSRFLGQEMMSEKTGDSYRYFIGLSSDRKSADSKFNEIKKKYPDSFMVRIEKGASERLK